MKAKGRFFRDGPLMDRYQGFMGVGSPYHSPPALRARSPLKGIFVDPLSRFAAAPPRRGSGVFGRRLAVAAGTCARLNTEPFCSGTSPSLPAYLYPQVLWD